MFYLKITIYWEQKLKKSHQRLSKHLQGSIFRTYAVVIQLLLCIKKFDTAVLYLCQCICRHCCWYCWPCCFVYRTLLLSNIMSRWCEVHFFEKVCVCVCALPDLCCSVILFPFVFVSFIYFLFLWTFSSSWQLAMCALFTTHVVVIALYWEMLLLLKRVACSVFGRRCMFTTRTNCSTSPLTSLFCKTLRWCTTAHEWLMLRKNIGIFKFFLVHYFF